MGSSGMASAILVGPRTSVKTEPQIRVECRPVLLHLASLIDGTAWQSGAVYLLSQIRGFPPMIQTVHILSISAIMGSIVLLDLRLLGLALRGQSVRDLTSRLLPWTWAALPTLFVSGIVFVLARPQRYAINPVFRIKFMLLVPAILLTLAFHLISIKDRDFWSSSASRQTLGKVIGLCSLLLWTAVVLAGRWIAYSDYLLPPEE